GREGRPDAAADPVDQRRDLHLAGPEDPDRPGRGEQRTEVRRVARSFSLNGSGKMAANSDGSQEQKWLLQSDAPWGADTYISKRLEKGEQPWDTGCKVTTLVGGYAAMSAMREALQTAIDSVTQAP